MNDIVNKKLGKKKKSVKTQTIKISDYEWEKVLKNDVDMPIPTEPYFYQEDNGMTVFGLFPTKFTEDFASRKKGEIYRLSIVKIDLRSIIKTSINVNSNELSDIMLYGDRKGLSMDDRLRYEVVYYLRHYFGEGETTHDFFRRALIGQINGISEDLNFELKEK